MNTADITIDEPSELDIETQFTASKRVVDDLLGPSVNLGVPTVSGQTQSTITAIMAEMVKYGELATKASDLEAQPDDDRRAQEALTLMEARLWLALGPREDAVKVPCPRCNTKGIVMMLDASGAHHAHCPACRGTGKVSPPPAVPLELARVMEGPRTTSAPPSAEVAIGCNHPPGCTFCNWCGFRDSEAVARVVSSGPEANLPILQWLSADHSFRAPIGTLLCAAPAQSEASAHHGLDNDRQVLFYEQDFYVLSNFSSFNVKWRDHTFMTSEHAYHWAKFDGHWDATNCAGSIAWQVQRAPSAHEAFKIAEGCKPRRRPDWDEVKVDIMREILFAKAEQHEYVRRKLLATGDRELIENSWRDDFWGWGPNRDGQNMLGKLWMEVRTAIAAKATS